MKSLIAFVSGLIFAAGLAISGMTQPHKVIAFLDFTGDWDASLMFVMVGAIAIYASARWLILLRRRPILDSKFYEPADTKITKTLVFGALIFGIGWGLGGYCPGPAIASLATLAIRPAVFVMAMIAGMAALRFTRKKTQL